MSGRRSVPVLALVNGLTALRLALAASFLWLPHEWRLPAVVLAAASDFLDGLIARRFAGTSWVVGLLDAIADKLFVLAVLASVVLEDQLDLPLVLPLLARDLAVAGVAVAAALMGRWDDFRRMPSRPPGKLTTALLFALFALLLAAPQSQAAVHTVYALAAAASAVAAADYLRQAMLARRKRPSGGEEPAAD